VLFYVPSAAAQPISPRVRYEHKGGRDQCRKGQKRTPLPAPALTEKDFAHLNWIRRNSTHLVRSVLKLYRRGGRGAFFVIVFLYRSGAASSYTIRFVKLGDTFTVEAA
jgi:hypothetical protein